MTKRMLIAGVCVSTLIGSVGIPGAEEPLAPEPPAQTKGDSTADHKKFQALQQDFQTGPEVTRACLSCHTEAANQMHQSIHWNWQWEKAGGLGKKNAINNF